MVPPDPAPNPNRDTELDSDPDPDRDRLVVALEVASRPFMQTLLRATEAPPAQVTGSQLAALRAIERRPALNMTQLADELGTIPSWASRLCDRLEADGYIERRTSEEGRRQVAIELRRPGRDLLDDIAARRREILGRAVATMGDADRRALLRGLQAFERAVRRDRREDPGSVRPESA